MTPRCECLPDPPWAGRPARRLLQQAAPARLQPGTPTASAASSSRSDCGAQTAPLSVPCGDDSGAQPPIPSADGSGAGRAEHKGARGDGGPAGVAVVVVEHERAGAGFCEATGDAVLRADAAAAPGGQATGRTEGERVVRAVQDTERAVIAPCVDATQGDPTVGRISAPATTSARPITTASTTCARPGTACRRSRSSGTSSSESSHPSSDCGTAASFDRRSMTSCGGSTATWSMPASACSDG